MLNFVRSLAFNVLFYLNTLIYLVIALPTFFLPYRAIIAVARSWARTNLMLLRVVAGIKYEIRGREKMPTGPIIVAVQASIGVGDLRAGHAVRQPDLHPQA